MASVRCEVAAMMAGPAGNPRPRPLWGGSITDPDAVRTIPRTLYTLAAAAQLNTRNLEWGMTRKVVITLTLED